MLKSPDMLTLRSKDIMDQESIECSSSSSSSSNRECKPPPTPKFETKVIRDSNSDFPINLDPGVHRIRPEIVDVSSRRCQPFR